MIHTNNYDDSVIKRAGDFGGLADELIGIISRFDDLLCDKQAQIELLEAEVKALKQSIEDLIACKSS
jgi:hypothetical protein